jgi:hypothetical protein
MRNELPETTLGLYTRIELLYILICFNSILVGFNINNQVDKLISPDFSKSHYLVFEFH